MVPQSSQTRRKFLKTSALAATSAAFTQSQTKAQQSSTQDSSWDLKAPKMDLVRVGLIGVGQRGSWHVKTLLSLEGIAITAICDTHEKVLDEAIAMVEKANKPKPARFTGTPYAYRRLLDFSEVDIVIISTPWRWHAPMCVETMKAGKHAFVEVPAALTIDECWQLVETSEQTKKHCMMLENVCYGRDELLTLNLVRKGLLGELLHGEGAYIHELRWQMKEIDHSTGSWRTGWHTRRDANLYPTHGLGPIAQYMNVNRGDRFDYLTSMSSPARGRALYAQANFPSDHPRNQARYITGDMNSSLIKTKLGKTILVQHDTTTPRPYTRLNLISGTKGVFAGFPNRLALEGQGDFHKWNDDMASVYAKHDHPLWVRLQKEAEANGGHGGMDFVMMWRLIYCLRNGQELDQDVYDAAAWSAVTPLSEASVANRSQSKDFPDFTRGKWSQRPPLGIVT